MKKMIATLLAVCMLLMMVPAIGVSAESIIWPIYGENVTIGGKTYEYVGDMGSDFDLIELDESVLDWPHAGRFGAGYFTWDGEDTLVLNVTTGSFEEVYSTIEVDDLDANIVFEGKNVWNVTNEAVSYYTFDLYDEVEEGNGENVVTICGTGSLELNVTSDSYMQVFYGEPDLKIYDVEMDVSVSAPYGDVIYGKKTLEIENADISIDMTYDAMDSSCDLVFGEDAVVIKDSTLNLKGRDLTEYEEGEEVYYIDGVETYYDAVIDNSIVNIETEVQAWAYALYADYELHILNGSAVEVKAIGAYGCPLEAEQIIINDSYVRSIAEGSELAIAIDAFGDDETPIVLEDAELIAPANGTIERYVDEEEGVEGTSVLLPDDTYAAEVVIAPRSYADVSGNQWFSPAVGFATARGLFKGIDADNFAPFMQLTRAQMMTILARMSGANVDPAPGEIWYEKAVEWAVENGVSDGTDPNGKITREQMITMVWRYLGEPEGDGDLSQFTDGNRVASWAKDAMEWAVGNQVISGRGDGTLDPYGTANRAEAAQLLKNFLINY